MTVLVVDIGGNSVKLAIPDQRTTSVPTPAAMMPQQLVDIVHTHCATWHYDRISIGFPGPVRNDRPQREPVNLGSGWVGFDYTTALGYPVRMLNDAALQALGCYHGGVMLFLGLGTGLGTAMIHDSHIVPMEIAHLPFHGDETYESSLGIRGLEKFGLPRWKSMVLEVIELFRYALCPDYIALGGGNAMRFEDSGLPEHVERVDNSRAVSGGLLLWYPDDHQDRH